MGSFKNLTAAMHAPWMTRFKNETSKAVRGIDHAFSYNFARLAKDSSDNDVEVWRVGPSNNVTIAGEVVKPTRVIKKFQLDANGDIVDSVLFIADRTYKIYGIDEVHTTAGSTSSCIIRRCEGTEAITDGQALTSAIDLTTTADTVQAATMVSDLPRSDGTLTLELVEGDRLAVDFTGTTSLVNPVFTIEMSPSNESETVDISLAANGDLVDQNFYVATRPMKVVGIKQIHGTLGTNGSAVSLQVTKDVSTNAPGAGTNLLTNNTNAGFNLKSAINTVQEGALAATAATLKLATGDRLSLDFAGTLTAVAGLVVSVELAPIYDCKEVVYHLTKNASLGTDSSIFTADRNYRIVRAYETHATAAGATLKLQLEVCAGTTAAGSGTELLSNNSSAGFDLNGTADTVQSATWIDTDKNYLLEGDRLAVDFSTTVTSLADLTVVVALEAI